ncbi:MAG: hypothetical protein IJ407_01320 [Clostridia bacterium]|nr:hypothetical protein [Clostridia bacterium]
MNLDYENRPEKPSDPVGCPVVGYQDVDVSVPVTIKPFGEVGNAKTQCVGKPVVCSDRKEHHGKSCEVCRFTISQKLRVEVPVIFGARAEIGEATVDCGRAETDEKCKDCDEHKD